MSESAENQPPKDADGTPSDEQKVKMTPLLWTLGIVALIVGVGSGLVMSQATFFR